MRVSMDNSPRYRNDSQLPSPSSTSISTMTRPVTTRSESASPYSTTIIQTDRSSFKKVVQLLTAIPDPTYQPDPRYSSLHSIPPIKTEPNKKQSSSFCLYKRRNLMKHHLEINPTHSGLPEIISPSILDFPSLVLSPVTPLVSPFYGPGSLNPSPSGPGFEHHDPKPNSNAEEKAIKEKGFYLLPSPSTTPRDSKPRLLPLFPVTSPLSHKP